MFCPRGRHGLAARCEIEIADGKRLSFSDTNAGVPQEPNDDALLVVALRVEQRAVFVWSDIWPAYNGNKWFHTVSLPTLYHKRGTHL